MTPGTEAEVVALSLVLGAVGIIGTIIWALW